jgi:hypothetical protein
MRNSHVITRKARRKEPLRKIKDKFVDDIKMDLGDEG